MQFTASAASFKKGWRLLSSVEKSIYPISMSARGGGGGSPGSITIQTLEENKFVSISFTGEVVKEGEVMFSSQYLPLFEGDHDLTIIAKKDSFVIRGSCDFSVPIYSGIRLTVPSKQPIGSATFDLADIKQLFRRVFFAIGDDSEASYNFRCMLLECNYDLIRAIGGDRRLVALAELPKGSSYKGAFVLPKGGLYTINKLDGEMVTLTFYNGGIMFSSSGELMCDIYMPEIGRKPSICNYATFTDTVKGNTFLTCNRDVLLGKIADIRKVSEEMFIAMKYDGHGVRHPLRLFAREADGPAQVNAIIPTKWDGVELKMAVNARTFYQAVEQVIGDDVNVTFSSSIGPLVIEGVAKDYRTVMLPYSFMEKR